MHSLLRRLFFACIMFFTNALFFSQSFAQAGMWTWMTGSDGFYEPGVFGTKGVPDPLNTPPLYMVVCPGPISRKFLDVWRTRRQRL
jgi:hypothetical protein